MNPNACATELDSQYFLTKYGVYDIESEGTLIFGLAEGGIFTMSQSYICYATSPHAERPGQLIVWDKNKRTPREPVTFEKPFYAKFIKIIADRIVIVCGSVPLKGKAFAKAFDLVTGKQKSHRINGSGQCPPIALMTMVSEETRDKSSLESSIVFSKYRVFVEMFCAASAN